MGIKIFLNKNLGKAPTEFAFEERYYGIALAGIRVAESLNNFFTPIEVDHWRYVVEEELGGEFVESVPYREFVKMVEERSIKIGILSVLRIKGEWKFGNIEREGFVSINISTYANKRGDIHMDIEPSDYEDITDMIFEQPDRLEVTRQLISSLKSIKINTQYSTFTVNRIDGEDDGDQYFIYSKEKRIVWKLAESYLNKTESIDEVKPYYNWERMYELLTENASVKSVLKNVEGNYKVVEEPGSVLLIGQERESLREMFNELSRKLEGFMEKLDEKVKIQAKIEEFFGGQVPIDKY